jgi:hypothetical protein
MDNFLYIDAIFLNLKRQEHPGIIGQKMIGIRKIPILNSANGRIKGYERRS